jgi:virginiamycin A acetyltransferase
VQTFLRWVDRTTVTTSLWVAVALAVLAALAQGRTAALGWPVVIAAASGLLPLSAIYVNTAILRAQRRVAWSLLPLRVLRPVLGAGIAAAVFFATEFRTGIVAVYAEVAALIALAILLAGMTRTARAGEAVPATPEDRREWSRATSHMTIAEIAQQMVGQVDVIVVGLLFGVAAAGVYGLASRLARLVLLGNKAANSVAGPMIAKAYFARDVATMQSVVSHTCTVAAAGTVVASLGFFLLPAAAYEWLGPGFVEARAILSVLLLAQVVNAITGPVGLVLVLTGNERSQAVVNIIAGVALLGGIVLIAQVGGDVMDVAVLLAFVIALSNLVKVFIVHRRTGVLAIPFFRQTMTALEITPRNRRFHRLWLALFDLKPRGTQILVSRGSNLSAARVRIERGARINGPCVAKGRGDLVIGAYCAIGYDVKFITSNHTMSGLNLNVALQRRLGVRGGIDEQRQGVTVGANAWIGDNAILLPGVEVGVGAIIGAGTVVTRSVPAFGICVGNPGRVIRRRFSDALCDELERSAWWLRNESEMRQLTELFEITDVGADESRVRALLATLERGSR